MRQYTIYILWLRIRIMLNNNEIIRKILILILCTQKQAHSVLPGSWTSQPSFLSKIYVGILVFMLNNNACFLPGLESRIIFSQQTTNVKLQKLQDQFFSNHILVSSYFN